MRGEKIFFHKKLVLLFNGSSEKLISSEKESGSRRRLRTIAFHYNIENCTELCMIVYLKNNVPSVIVLFKMKSFL